MSRQTNEVTKIIIENNLDNFIVDDIKEHTKLTKKTIQTYLSILKRKGFIIHTGYRGINHEYRTILKFKV